MWGQGLPGGAGGGEWTGSLPSWSSGIARSLFMALSWTSGRLELCMTSAGGERGEAPARASP